MSENQNNKAQVQAFLYEELQYVDEQILSLILERTNLVGEIAYIENTEGLKMLANDSKEAYNEAIENGLPLSYLENTLIFLKNHELLTRKDIASGELDILSAGTLNENDYNNGQDEHIH